MPETPSAEIPTTEARDPVAAATETTTVEASASRTTRSWAARLRSWFSRIGRGPGDDRVDLVLALLAIASWFLLFAVGYTISSAPLMGQLNDQQTPPLRAAVLIVQVACVFTVTNVGILCMLGGFVGAVCSRVTEPDRPRTRRLTQYLQAFVGSFLIFLITTGGAYSLLGVSFSPPPAPPPQAAGPAASPAPGEAPARPAPGQPTPEQLVSDAQDRYKNLAAITSFICLIEGYSPFMMNGIVKRLRG